jgi:hypothetical protein
MGPGASQVLSRFGPQLHGHVSTREEEGQGGGNQNTHTPLLGIPLANLSFLL